jgi:hypothetical protein
MGLPCAVLAQQNLDPGHGDGRHPHAFAHGDAMQLGEDFRRYRHDQVDHVATAGNRCLGFWGAG